MAPENGAPVQSAGSVIVSVDDSIVRRRSLTFQSIAFVCLPKVQQSYPATFPGVVTSTLETPTYNLPLKYAGEPVRTASSCSST